MMAEDEEGTHARGEKSSGPINQKEKEMVMDEDIFVSVEQTTEGVKLNFSDNNKKEAIKVEEKMPVEPSASILITSDLKTPEVQGNGLIEGVEMDPLVKRANEPELIERSANNDITEARLEALNVIGSRDANNDEFCLQCSCYYFPHSLLIFGQRGVFMLIQPARVDL